MTLAERIEKFNNLMGDIVPSEVKKDLLEKGFFTAPASTKYHGNYEGGLFDHSYMVAHYLKKLTEECRLDWQNPRSPLLVGMFHDLCKMDNYQHPVIAETLGGEEIRDDFKWEYATDTLLKGHGDKSVMVLAQYFKLTEEEIMCIRYHMGAFCDKSEWNDYTRAVHKYTNVLWTHQADMLASHVEGGEVWWQESRIWSFCSIRHNRLSPMTRTSFRRLPRLRRMIAARKSTSISVLSVSHRFGVAPVPGSM